MRDISELIERKRPVDALPPEEVARLLIEEDMRLINTFHPPARPQRESIGRRPWT